MTMTVAQTGQSITFTGATSGKAGTSGTFTVDPGVATNLKFGVQPTNADFSTIITPAITVQVKDAYGNVITTDITTSVTIAIGTNPSGGVISGTTNRTAASGVATFNDISINLPGTGYTLTVSSIPFLTVATSNAFNMTGTLPPPPPTPTNTEATTQLAAFETPRLPAPDLRVLQTFQTNTFTPTVRPVYFYQPLTFFDMAAFDTMFLAEDDLSFLNGEISLGGHAGLLPS
jgi:hypothetical protein